VTRRFLPFARPAGRPESVSGAVIAGTAAAGALRSARSITDDGTPSQPLPVLAQPLVPQARRADRSTAERVDWLLHQLVEAPRFTP